jgi:hypothetical protein
MAADGAVGGSLHIHCSFRTRVTNGAAWVGAHMDRKRAPDAVYVLGHSKQELERLIAQARLYEPLTRQFFLNAGITAGMRVLDFGCGAEDVSFLLAQLVGPTGQVLPSWTIRSPLCCQVFCVPSPPRRGKWPCTGKQAAREGLRRSVGSARQPTSVCAEGGTMMDAHPTNSTHSTRSKTPLLAERSGSPTRSAPRS